MENKRINIVYKKVDDLIPYDNNPRNNDEAVDYVAKSIDEFGFKVPCVVSSDGVLITGHTRLKACKKLGIEEVPCIVADDLTEEQVKAFRIADNKVSEIATWDMEKLNIELDNIDIDMSEFGFNDMQIQEDDFEPINDEGLENTENFEHKLKLDNITLILTDEEAELFKIKLDEYVQDNGVSFGFINKVLG